MTFVDTGAWAALFVPADPLHDAAREWLRENRDRLITSDYVVDEVLTLLKTRFSAQASIRGGQALFGEHFSQLVYLTSEDIERAWKVFRSHADKRWSFTDCTSLAVMGRLRISKAFAFDKHFSQMRGVRRLPE
jgi:uncharacterized protein